MINAIVMDIDGVIVGDKVGINTPYPAHLVTNKLKEIRTKNIPIILCTAKPHYAIEKIITDAHLDNPHITDGGAVIIDPISQNIIAKHIIEKSLVQSLLQTYVTEGIYTEIYTSDQYFIQKNQKDAITQIHERILQRAPIIVDSLIEESKHLDIVKVMPISKNDTTDYQKLFTLFEPFKAKATIGIGLHPVANPHRFGAITEINVSKKQATIDVIHSLGISFDQCLGIGDSTTDWQFMELCGHQATLENGTAELKKLVEYISPSVDDNGILSIFEHFSL